MQAPATATAEKTLDPESLLLMASGLALDAEVWRARIDTNPTARTGLRVLVNDAYEVWILRWPTGGAVRPHDHGASNAAFAVTTGILKEIRWSGGIRSECLLGPGDGASMQTGVVHDVVACQEALSVHVYSPPLSRMAFFDEQARTVVAEKALDPEDDHFLSGDDQGGASLR